MKYEAAEHAVTHGISCEACHLGCKEHVADPKVKPDFHPHSPLLLVRNANGKLDVGRTRQNLNWACASPDEDDVSCIRCHSEYESEAAIASHTHHDAASSGSRCMNCHMPKLNEGINSIVRTHTIFSPTNPAMIEANHPNACNRCHTDRPID